MTTAAELLGEVARCLGPAVELILTASRAQVTTFEAARGGPARRCGTSDETTIALRHPAGVATLHLTRSPGEHLDARSLARALGVLADTSSPGVASWPAVEHGFSRDWAGSWDRVTSTWERLVQQQCARLRPGESVDVTLERVHTEVVNSAGRRCEVVRHHASGHVVVPAWRQGPAGWEMTVPLEVGRCQGLLATLRRARLHAKVRAAGSLPRGAADSRAGGEGRVVLGPAAVAEALARWRHSADARRGHRRPGLAGVVAAPAAVEPGNQSVARLLRQAVAPWPTWRVAAGDAHRRPRTHGLSVTHIEAWLPGPDEEGVTALAAGIVRPGGPVSAVRIRLHWSRLESAIRNRHRRGPRTVGVHLGGADVWVPWLDLARGRWRALGARNSR